MVRVTSQGSKQEKSAEVRIKQRSTTRTGTGTQVYKIQGPRKNTHTHQGTDCRSGPSLKYTCIIKLQVFGWPARFESLIAESTRWPALVLSSPQGR
ncbi:unnamed protein product [Staurois parvus]|uniref:Uncharacterized protein n=1 Tax=Staurois parvus TaxID=386267 RepID=A0ABN9AQD7_9NEOB|nr:unnamed protein product [Staurois parvus]